jgi:hypothetical protein
MTDGADGQHRNQTSAATKNMKKLYAGEATHGTPSLASPSRISSTKLESSLMLEPQHAGYHMYIQLSVAIILLVHAPLINGRKGFLHPSDCASEAA